MFPPPPAWFQYLVLIRVRVRVGNAVDEALRALNSANLRRYTDLQCPKARQRRLKAVQRLVRVLLGDPNIVRGTNIKGEVCLNAGLCTASLAHLVAILHSQLRSMRP